MKGFNVLYCIKSFFYAIKMLKNCKIYVKTGLNENDYHTSQMLLYYA